MMRELRAVKDGMKGLDVTSDAYANFRIRENIVHQFEAITTKHELVGDERVCDAGAPATWDRRLRGERDGYPSRILPRAVVRHVQRPA